MDVLEKSTRIIIAATIIVHQLKKICKQSLKNVAIEVTIIPYMIAMDNKQSFTD